MTLSRFSLAFAALLATACGDGAASSPSMSAQQAAAGAGNGGPTSAGGHPGETTGEGGSGGAIGSLGVGGGAGVSATGGSGGAAPEGALEVYPAMYGGDGAATIPIADGDTVPLTLPIQGGHVLMLGARIRNLHTTTIKIHGSLKDPATGATVGEDTRTVVVSAVDGDPTLVQTNIQTNSQVANVPACPNYGPRPVNGLPWTLEVTVTELYVDVPRTATGMRTATPTCSTVEPDATQCACECDSDYALGKCPVTNMGGG